MPHTKKDGLDPIDHRESEAEQLLIESADAFKCASLARGNARREWTEACDSGSTERLREARDTVASAEEFYLVAKDHYLDIMELFFEGTLSEGSERLSIVRELLIPAE